MHMPAQVEDTTFLGRPAVRAANDHLAFVVVPEWGSNLISLVDLGTGAELLRVPETADTYLQSPILYGTPILFPPNRIADGRFTYRGREYRFDVNEPERNNHIHGLVYDRPWDVAEVRTDGRGRATVTTRFDAARHPAWSDIARQFPHPFVITMRYTLDGATLHKTAAVHNAGDEPFPLGLGFHTTFRFPEATARFALSVTRRWRLNERLLPTGQLEELPHDLPGSVGLEGVPLDDAFFVGGGEAGLRGAAGPGGAAPGGAVSASEVLGEAGPSAAVLTYPVLSVSRDGAAAAPGQAIRIEIRYEADRNFRHWVVYNADGRSGFICPEPYTWITNAPNLTLPASLTGFQELGPGETKVFATSITVKHAHDEAGSS